MQIPAIKKLIEAYSIVELRKAEALLADEKPAGIDVEGESEGDQLTHVFAAIWILDKMNSEGVKFKKALREFTSKVRESIN